MTKVTASVRNTIRAMVATRSSFNGASIQIHRNGLVSAQRDPQKTRKGSPDVRFVMGHVTEMVGADGTARPDWSG
jgi:hypothetical protein